jgi:Coenzyme A transferase
MNVISLEEAVAMIPDGASLMVGGFMGVGTPERVMDEIVRQGKKDLTVIANDTAAPNVGIGKLVGAKLLRKAIVSHIGLNPETQKQMMAGELEVELVRKAPSSSAFAPPATVLAEFSHRRVSEPSRKRTSSASSSPARPILSKPRLVPTLPSSRLFSPIISAIFPMR